MKVLITGSRGYYDEPVIFEALKDLPEGTHFIVGDARGADEIAISIITNQYGKERNWTVKIFKAEWNKYGKAAGPIRNYEMIKQEPDMVLAFKNGESPGTNHMVGLARDYFRSKGFMKNLHSGFGAPWTEYKNEDGKQVLHIYG